MKNTMSIYGSAPEKVLSKLAELNSKLTKYPKGTANSEFWYSVSETMLFSYRYMCDVQFIWKRNEIVEAENKFLKEWSASLEARLNVYETIRDEMNKGTIEETINVVKSAIHGKEE